MFEFLEEELRTIRSKNFHVVDGPLSDEKRAMVEQSELPFPASYKRFVIRFGRARLYREGSIYQVQVLSVPSRVTGESGEELEWFGRNDLKYAYFKPELLRGDEESPVFEQGGGPLRKVASGFEEWLRRRCRVARRLFKKAEWRKIVEGPEPFTEEERRIVEARRKFSWKVLGVADNGDLIFEVFNGSDMVLPYLSVGTCDKHGERFGAVALPVWDIRPGERKVVEKDCYKEHYPPHEVRAVARPDPEPDIRDLYSEFWEV